MNSALLAKTAKIAALKKRVEQLKAKQAATLATKLPQARFISIDAEISCTARRTLSQKVTDQFVRSQLCTRNSSSGRSPGSTMLLRAETYEAALARGGAPTTNASGSGRSRNSFQSLPSYSSAEVPRRFGSTLVPLNSSLYGRPTRGSVYAHQQFSRSESCRNPPQALDFIRNSNSPTAAGSRERSFCSNSQDNVIGCKGGLRFGLKQFKATARKVGQKLLKKFSFFTD